VPALENVSGDIGCDMSEDFDRAIENANCEHELVRMRIQEARNRQALRRRRPTRHCDSHRRQCLEQTPHGQILTRAARASPHKDIDAENSRRREMHAWWWKTVVIPAITMLIALVGGLTGLVALLKKH